MYIFHSIGHTNLLLLALHTALGQFEKAVRAHGDDMSSSLQDGDAGPAGCLHPSHACLLQTRTLSGGEWIPRDISCSIFSSLARSSHNHCVTSHTVASQSCALGEPRSRRSGLVGAEKSDWACLFICAALVSRVQILSVFVLKNHWIVFWWHSNFVFR